MTWLNIITQGIMVGGLYALFAAGLSLIFGVMRLVNIAHGDLIVAAAYLALVIVTATGLHPLLSLVIVVPLAMIFGYALQRGILNRTLGKDLLAPLLVTFGLSVIIQNGLLATFTADNRRLQIGSLESGSFEILSGFNIGYFQLLQFLTAVVVIGALQYMFYHTSAGRALRATSDDPETAGLMGLDRRHVYGTAMALCLGVVAIAGVFMGARAPFDPAMGPGGLIFGFEAVIIGGLGNLWGTLVGGIILGVAQAIGAQINPGWQVLAGHLVFLLVLAVRPRGLFPRMTG
jgi:branched-chain amino acid transport system permease protein